MNTSSLNTDPVRDARDQLVSDLQMLTTHAQDLLHATRSLSGDAAKLARERLDESLAVARQQLEQLRQTADQRSRTALAQLDAQINSHPRESIAVAALTSLALGWLSRGGAAGVLGNLARLAAFGVAGTAGAVLWSYRNGLNSSQAEPQPEEVGRWESEGGGSPPGANPAL